MQTPLIEDTPQLTLVPVGLQPDRPDPVKSRTDRLVGALRSRAGLLVMVVLPTLLTAIYMFLLAANRYEAETKFIVRSPSAGATSQFASLLQGSSIVRSADDSFIVHAYLESRDILRRLTTSAGLLEKLNRREADFLWRYPGWLLRANEERLYEHMKSIVHLDYDHSTGISTLKVQGFRPEDARDLAEAMLRESENLINRLSERAQSDAIHSAEAEVTRAREVARLAHEQVTSFRNRNAMIDPGRVSATTLETISRLALEMAQTNAQIAEVEKSAPQSNQISNLRFRLAALDSQILKERQRLAGADTSLAPLIAEYERLNLEREFAERSFTSALTSLEAARLDVQRQRLFLERIANPVAPDYPLYPRPLFSILSVFAVCWMLYSIGSRLVAETLAHSEM